VGSSKLRWGGLGLHNKPYRLRCFRGSRAYAPGPDDEEEKEEGGWMFSKNGMEYKCCKDFDGEILMERNLLDILVMSKMINMYLKEKRLKVESNSNGSG